MDLDGVFDKRPSQKDSSKYLEDPWRDPRFSALRQERSGQPGNPAGTPEVASGSPLTGDDRLQLSRKSPNNPLGALIRFRRRRRDSDSDLDTRN